MNFAKLYMLSVMSTLKQRGTLFSMYFIKKKIKKWITLSLEQKIR